MSSFEESEAAYWKQIEVAAKEGDLESLTTYATGLIQGFYGEGRAKEGVDQLRSAHALGSLRATYELATISSPRARRMIGFSRAERAKLLLDAAMGGNTAAALDLSYHYSDCISADDLRSTLAVAANLGSTEARDILSRM